MSSRRDSDFERLEQLLQEERRNRQEADERAKDADERAELAQRCVENKQQNHWEAESCAQIKGKKIRSIIFEEYICIYYTLFLKSLCI